MDDRAEMGVEDGVLLFNSHRFLFLFLPLVLVVAMRLRARALLGWITLASFVFYAYAGHAWFLLPMLFTTALDFFLAPAIAAAEGPRRLRLLWVSLCGNLGLLAYFKYGGLLAHSLQAFVVLAGGAGDATLFTLFDVVLPAGISFYTFQTLSYVIDVYRGECPAERDFLTFAGFVSFFPHLVAGPLTRHNQLIPALERIAETGVRPRWRDGLYLFAMGLSKKVLIADRVAQIIDPVIAGDRFDLVSGWIAMLGYAIQIYFDFSGYSDMAIGLGRLFDVELPQNFDSPYQAKNPSDFWRRWHMTLSAWLRDYLYISLGGNRCTPGRRSFNLMATMVLGGLWHGASWTFALWGGLHGLMLIVYQRYGHTWDRLPRAAQRAVFFLLVCVTWIPFRATSFGQPVGPWRDCLRDVHADLEADGLGSHDEYGQFYITVPGGMIRRSAWVEFEEPDRPPHAATFGRRAR
ncbi:MAG: MBOAT family protein [Rhizobiaceae bacterium]|nr:MAG: MBOAT family protein [Rhizobiaceae bacterium]